MYFKGRIHQIEYAMEAVKQGSAAVGLKSKTHAILVALKVKCLMNLLKPVIMTNLSFLGRMTLWTELFLQRAPSELSSHQKKILHIDNHVGVAIAGLTADARGLRFVNCRDNSEMI